QVIQSLGELLLGRVPLSPSRPKSPKGGSTRTPLAVPSEGEDDASVLRALRATFLVLTSDTLAQGMTSILVLIKELPSVYGSASARSPLASQANTQDTALADLSEDTPDYFLLDLLREVLSRMVQEGGEVEEDPDVSATVSLLWDRLHHRFSLAVQVCAGECLGHIATLHPSVLPLISQRYASLLETFKKSDEQRRIVAYVQASSAIPFSLSLPAPISSASLGYLSAMRDAMPRADRGVLRHAMCDALSGMLRTQLVSRPSILQDPSFLEVFTDIYQHAGKWAKKAKHRLSAWSLQTSMCALGPRAFLVSERGGENIAEALVSSITGAVMSASDIETRSALITCLKGYYDTVSETVVDYDASSFFTGQFKGTIDTILKHKGALSPPLSDHECSTLRGIIVRVATMSTATISAVLPVLQTMLAMTPKQLHASHRRLLLNALSDIAHHGHQAHEGEGEGERERESDRQARLGAIRDHSTFLYPAVHPVLSDPDPLAVRAALGCFPFVVTPNREQKTLLLSTLGKLCLSQHREVSNAAVQSLLEFVQMRPSTNFPPVLRVLTDCLCVSVTTDEASMTGVKLFSGVCLSAREYLAQVEGKSEAERERERDRDRDMDVSVSKCVGACLAYLARGECYVRQEALTTIVTLDRLTVLREEAMGREAEGDRMACVMLPQADLDGLGGGVTEADIEGVYPPALARLHQYTLSTQPLPRNIERTIKDAVCCLSPCLVHMAAKGAVSVDREAWANGVSTSEPKPLSETQSVSTLGRHKGVRGVSVPMAEGPAFSASLRFCMSNLHTACKGLLSVAESYAIADEASSMATGDEMHTDILTVDHVSEMVHAVFRLLRHPAASVRTLVQRDCSYIDPSLHEWLVDQIQLWARLRHMHGGEAVDSQHVTLLLMGMRQRGESTKNIKTVATKPPVAALVSASHKQRQTVRREREERESRHMNAYHEKMHQMRQESLSALERAMEVDPRRMERSKASTPLQKTLRKKEMFPDKEKKLSRREQEELDARNQKKARKAAIELLQQRDREKVHIAQVNRRQRLSDGSRAPSGLVRKDTAAQGHRHHAIGTATGVPTSRMKKKKSAINQGVYQDTAGTTVARSMAKETGRQTVAVADSDLPQVSVALADLLALCAHILDTQGEPFPVKACPVGEPVLPSSVFGSVCPSLCRAISSVNRTLKTLKRNLVILPASTQKVRRHQLHNAVLYTEALQKALLKLRDLLIGYTLPTTSPLPPLTAVETMPQFGGLHQVVRDAVTAVRDKTARHDVWRPYDEVVAGNKAMEAKYGARLQAGTMSLPCETYTIVPSTAAMLRATAKAIATLCTSMLQDREAEEGEEADTEATWVERVCRLKDLTGRETAELAGVIVSLLRGQARIEAEADAPTHGFFGGLPLPNLKGTALASIDDYSPEEEEKVEHEVQAEAEAEAEAPVAEEAEAVETPAEAETETAPVETAVETAVEVKQVEALEEDKPSFLERVVDAVEDVFDGSDDEKEEKTEEVKEEEKKAEEAVPAYVDDAVYLYLRLSLPM
ncbi:hypothetical protein KIPB_005990, partial [Kipferlia bialata]